VIKARAWQRTHVWPTDMTAFPRDILPCLADLTGRDIATATGLSIGYCLRIKKGEAVPHPMWWAAFETVAAEPISGR